MDEQPTHDKQEEVRTEYQPAEYYDERVKKAIALAEKHRPAYAPKEDGDASSNPRTS